MPMRNYQKLPSAHCEALASKNGAVRPKYYRASP